MLVLRYIKRYVKKYKLLVLILTGLIIIVLGFVSVYYKSLPDKQRVNLVRSSTFIQKILPAWRSIKKVSDIFYLPYYFKQHNLETYKLEIESKVLKKMSDNLPPLFSDAILTDEFKDWYPAKLTTPTGEEFDLKVRYRGDNSIHWDSPKKSLLVKFKKNQAYRGMKKINFIIPQDRNFVLEHVHLNQSRKLDLPEPYSDFALLEINNNQQGLYFVVEGWSSSLLARNNLSEELNFFSFTENSSWLDKQDILFDDLRNWKKYTRDTHKQYSDYSYGHIFLQAANEWPQDYFNQHIFDLLDQDNFFAWLIPQRLSGSVHQVSNNLRLIFDNITGKFKFISWDVGLFYPPVFDPSVPLIGKILLDPAKMHQKNLLLWDYLNTQQGSADDINFFDQTWQDVKVALYQDRNKIYSNRHADRQIKEIKGLFLHNINYIKEKLKTARALVYYKIHSPGASHDSKTKVNLSLDIIVDNPVDLIMDQLDLSQLDFTQSAQYSIFYDSDHNDKLSPADEKIVEFDSSQARVRELNKVLLYTQRELPDQRGLSLIIKKTKHTFFIISENNIDSNVNWQDLKLEFKNAVTGDILDKQNIEIRHINQAVFANFDLISHNWAKIKNTYSFLYPTRLLDNRIIFPTGLYQINSSFIIPKGYQVVFEPGVKLVFSPQVSILSYSPVMAIGMPQAPVVFTVKDSETKWGTFVIVNTKDTKSIFENTIFEHGGQGFINGIKSSGMLSLFSSTGQISQSTFRYAAGDDALNIKKTDSLIKNNLFYRNKFDALDLDWNNSIVDNNMFIENGNDAIDVSSSQPIIKNNYIHQAGDKGISLGEKSQAIIYNNIVNQALTAIASKDLSRPIIFNNNITNSDIGLKAYQKKEIFGGSQPVLYNNVFYNNQQDQQTDELSNVDSHNDFYAANTFIDLDCNEYGLCAHQSLSISGQVFPAILDYLPLEYQNNDSFYLGIFNRPLLENLFIFSSGQFK